MNANFGNELNAICDRLGAAFESVRQGQHGKPIEDTKLMLAEDFAVANVCAQMTDPELTTRAEALAPGKRVWVDRQTRQIRDDD
jgi:hypothetical protein